MANKDTGAGGGGKRPTSGTRQNRNAYCSFCRKSYRDVGPLVEGPGDVYICGECIELCQSIIDQEKRRRVRFQGTLHQHPDATLDQGQARSIRHRPATGEEGALRRCPQPLQTAELG